MMATLVNKHLDEVYIEIKDKPETGFLDFEYDQSLQNYNPQDEGPIVISIPFPFVNGKPQSAFIGETSADSISIENSTCDPVELWHVRIYFQNPEDSYILSLMKPPSADTSQEAAESFVGMTSLENMVLQPGQTLTVWLSCKPKDIGLHTAIVHFDLWDERFERVVFLLGEDKASRAFFSKRPHTRAPPHGRRAYYDKHVAGYHPPQSSKNQRRKFRLSEYRIPKEIREMVENKQVPDVIMEGLDGRSYAKYFSILIAMEEIHLEEEMRARDMEHVTMKKRGKHFLSLEVPGLAERRPSLVCGDYIFASHATEDPANDKHYYQGYIRRVEADKIFVKFGDNFHQYHRDEDLLNVNFTYDRVNMRRLYQAVNEAENLGSEFLFPSRSYQRRVVRTSPLKPLNPFLNKEQLHSVEMILGCKGAPPYVIHGPPGTGKTSTLVEAILQLYTTRRRTRILVCASSNSAADHVLEKLLEKEGVVKENEIFRLNAASRPYEDVKPDLICFCFFNDVIFTCPPRKALLNYKIIISTYMSASLLHAEGMDKGYFSHIFLDDAGQASEPETIVPLSNLCAADTVIVLAGDPMQLAPVVYSRTAERHGLGKSYMERLFECDYYKSDENYVTKLVRNYRCHPAILELPSRLFYQGKLVPCREDNNSSIYDWEELPNKAFPVLFVGIQGCNEREGNNPSWFNRIEASKVVEIVRKLMRNTDISEADIGIITPYHQQVLKLKKALELLEMPDVKVGNVEKFQGQERQIIIISTVRSTVKYNEFDRTHNLGFLNNPRRFNVSTTRAKSLLIIVGNPHIISKDPYWDILLRHCADNGSYIGCPLPPPEKHYYINEAPKYEGGQDIPSLYSNEVEQGQDVPSQYSKEVEWGQDVPSHYSNEVDWDDGSVNQYSNEAGRDEDTLRQNFEETGWRNDMLKQYSNEVGWDGDNSNHNSRGSRRSVSIPKVRIFKWGDEVMNKDTLKQYSHETVWKSDITEPHSNEAGWSEDKSNWNSSKNGKNVSIPKASNFGWGDEFDD